MMIARFISALLVALSVTPLGAQVPAIPTIPAMPNMQDTQKMMAAYQSAAAAANRPGDNKLNCAQLEAEFQKIVSDPAFKAQVARAGAAAQRDLNAMAKAKAAQDAQLGATLGASAAATAKRQQQMAVAAQNAIEMLPFALRGGRVVELGVAKSCAWTTQANLGANWQGLPQP